MPLTTTEQLKLHIGISGTSEDVFLTQLLAGVTEAFERLVDRSLERRTYAEFYAGRGGPVVLLREYPVRRVALAGTLTLGSPVVTGLATTDDIALGAPCVATPAATGVDPRATPAVPVGAAVESIDSETQVTLSADADASGPTALAFGLAAWLDTGAAWGSASDAFGDGTHLVEGRDFALIRDGRAGLGEAGRLYRLNGVWPARWEWKTGLLSPAMRPSPGVVKVVYTAGYSSIPMDVQLALWQTCARLRAGRKLGLVTTSEHEAEYGYQLDPASAEAMTLASAKQVVSRYRRVTPRTEVMT